MSVRNVLSILENDPVDFAIRLASRAGFDYTRRVMTGKMARAGITGPCFLLSFDCDTTKDIEVLPSVHSRLTGAGIMPIYAVPGELLEQGTEVYQALHEDGAQFINHGYATHCQLMEDGTYQSSFFYDTLSETSIVEDMARGDDAIRRVLGLAPRGFRTPHFGTFQAPEHLALLYRECCKLGYKFSSSTTPLYAIKNSPLMRSEGIVEIPVSGCYQWPGTILDSWSFRFAPGRKYGEEDYIRQLRLYQDLMASGVPFLLNIYADPSQVCDWDEFFDAISAFAKYNLKSFEEIPGVCD